jgi:beta-lactamase class A
VKHHPITEHQDAKNLMAKYALFFVAGFAAALALLVTTTGTLDRPCKSLPPLPHTFTALTLPCDLGDKVSKRYEYDIKGDVQDYIDDATTRNITKHVSVYYYNFSDKSWFGINEDEDFYPASLLKVPILIGVMKQTETDPNFLAKTIVYNGTNSQSDQHYAPEVKLEKGKTYTVEELAQIAIKYSNNDAIFTLANLLGDDKMLTVYKDVGIQLPDNDNSNFISVRDYMKFFKILYNSYYLSRTDSEYVLKLLSETTFNDGLAAGVPEDVVVSHKFGEKADPSKDLKQLHDCGIVYAPKQPYLLCVMTRGSDFDNLSEIIKNVSQIVYKDVTNE